MEIPQSAIEEIRNLPIPAIVAISGFGGSGKSTAANKLAEVLRVPIICVDHFGIDRTIENYTHWKGMDFERLEKEVLIPFARGEDFVAYGHWDHEPNRVVKTVEVPTSSLLIVEGVGLFRPELMKYFNYKIW